MEHTNESRFRAAGASGPVGLFAAAASMAWSLCIASPTTHAQSRTAEATTRGAAVAERIRGEVTCLSALQTQVDQTLTLLRSTVGRLDQGPADARRDAALAVESLEQRLAELDQQARRCRDDRAIFPASNTQARGVSSTPSTPVAHSDEPSAADDGPALAVLDRDTVLAPGVRVTRAEQVDGTGSVETASLRPALQAQGSLLKQCYERYLVRGALLRGEVQLVFRVGASGTVSRVTTEGEALPDRTFRQCLERVGRGIRLARGASGGDVTVSYGLFFGDD